MEGERNRQEVQGTAWIPGRTLQRRPHWDPGCPSCYRNSPWGCWKWKEHWAVCHPQRQRLDICADGGHPSSRDPDQQGKGGSRSRQEEDL